ncbi:MAG TPA: alpha-amylase/4-alpha-glucanotransferase domain-containing protein [Candidatus Dormibacteraeota bacterium]|nr:alpha-amylase/4-alpha-glucanotransferase domain-containing protein [Candidatus Dormibacteraeota bacterium]
MPPKFHLSLLIHAHQPVGNFEDVIEKCYQNAYSPFVRMLEKHPAIRVGLHYSGPLLTWIERNHPEYFAELRALVRRGQVEMIGGGFYEPILAVIPTEDQVEQVTRLAGYLEKHFGKRPSGAWLAERVWEPQMPSALAAAQVSYSLVDDYHFLSAGFEPHELFGAYVAEDRGKCVRLFPGLKALRYLLPFGTVEDAMKFLRESAAIHPEGVAAMGDDMEKFGVWPGTFKHCYDDRWLENFFEALEANLDWLSLTPPGEYTESHTPLGRADLPTASYAEMTEWAFPTPVRRRYNAVQQEFSGRPEVAGFLHGGSWRGFFRKYAEANLLHKKMLRAATRVAAMPVRKIASKQTEELAEARDLLMRGQCNDAFWHGVFGGLYAPHLRTALWKNLIRAEWLADRQVPGGLLSRVELLDYDADGANELLFTSPECQALLKPSDGATLPMVDFRPVAATLVNSMQRRQEAYHSRLLDSTNSPSGVVASIHEQTRVKEQGLEKYLRYDRWARNAFRALIFSPKRAHEQYVSLQLQEDVGFAAGEYAVKSSGPQEAEIVREAMLPTKEGDVPFSLTKRFTFGPAPNGCEVACEIGIKLKEPLERAVMIGIESVINLLAPNDADRFFETAEGPQPLRMSGILPGPILRMEDGWQRVRITLHAPGTEDYWIAPIETVSESEGGFERVYQGCQILARWKMSTEKVFSARLVWRIESF